MMSLISRLKAGEERLLRDKWVRTAALVVLLLLCLAVTFYCHFVLRTDVVYSHLYYLPVALAGLWWGRRGLWLAVLLGVLLVTSHLVSGVAAPISASLLRAVILVAVGLIVGTVRDRTVRSEARTRRLNTVLRAIRNVNQLITQERDRDRLVKEACRHLVGERGYSTAWMGVFDDAGALPTTAEAGLGEAFEAMADRLKRGEFPPCVRRATVEAGVVVTSAPHAACADCPLSEVCAAGAAMTVRLKHDETVYGVLSVSIPADIAADEEERALFVEVATDLGFALHDIKLEDEREWAQERTRHLNAVLRAIRNVNQLITHETDRDRLLNRACEMLIETRGYGDAWIVLLDAAGGVVTTTEAGLGEAFGPMADRLRRGESPPCVRRATTQAGVVAVEDPSVACADCPLASIHESRAGMSIRLDYRGRLYGALTVSLPTDHVMDEGEQDLFQEVAGDLAFALHDIELMREREQAEAAVRESERRYRALLENVNVVAVGLDERGRVNYANPFLVSLTGYTREEIIGCAWFDQFVPERFRPAINVVFAELLEREFHPHHENAIVTRSGEEHLIAWNNTVLLDADGRPCGTMSIGEDITERKRAEGALRESEEKYRLISENIPVVVYSALPDEHSTGLFLSGRILELTGYTGQEYLEAPELYTRTIHPEDVARVWETIEEHRKAKAPLDVEYRIVTKGGVVKWIQDRATPTFGEDGEIVRIDGFIEDITERKRAEEALRESEERFRNLMEHIPGVSIQGYGTDGTVFYWNKASEHVYGYTAEEAVGRDLADLIVPPDLLPLFNQCLDVGKQVTESGEFMPAGELMLLHKDGRLVPVYSIHTAVCVEGKAPLLFCIDVDLSERKRVEDMMRAQRDLGLALSGTHRLEDGLRLCLDAALRVSGMDCGGVYVADEAGALDLAANEGLTADFVRSASCYDADSAGARLVMAGEPIYARHPDLGVPLDEAKRREGLRAIAVLPVRHDDHVIGCLNVASHTLDEVPMFARDALEAIAARIGSGVARLRAQEELARARRDWEEIFQAIGHPTFILSPDHTILAANRAVLEATGATEGELHGRKCYEIFHRADRPPDDCPLQRMLAADRLQTVQTEMDALDGTFLISCTPVLDSDGRLERVIHLATDITERKRAEAERLRLAMAVEQAAEAVVIRDADRVIRYVNPAFERMTGYTRDEVIARDPRAYRGGVHDDAFFEDVWATVARDGVWVGRIANQRKDGALIETETTVSAVRDASGAVTNYISIKRDVTREVQLEEQVRQAAKMEAVGQLAGGIAHDFNNLLAGILGYATIIIQEAESGSQTHDAATTIARTARRSADLAQQLLGFARRGKFRNEPIDLRRTIEDVVHLLRRTIEKRIAISLHLAPERVVVHGDPGQMEQVFLNLGVNARDAMPTGGELTFEARVVDVAEDDAEKNPAAVPGRYVVVSVADTGHGIPEGIRDRIFEPFFTTKEPGEGTGMGLATVYGIVTNHGGWVRVESEPGQGTTFTVALPLAEAGSALPANGKTDMPVRGTGRILVVDDEEVVRQTLCRMLGLLGYETTAAANGAEALACYQEPGRDFDLVIVDLVMPQMDGWQCCHALREIDPDVHLVVSTGYGAAGAAEEAVAEGVADFLAKPYRLSQLAAVISNAMKA